MIDFYFSDKVNYISMNVYVKKQNFLWQKILIRTGILLSLIIFLNIFQSPIRNSFYFISSPISKVFLQAGNTMSEFFSSFTVFSSIKKENNNLKEENEKLLSQLSSLQQSLRDNQELKTALESTKDSNFSILLVKVIGLDSQNDLILINKGSADGILENMPLISSQNVLYGNVLKVYKNFSQAMLVSNSNSVLDVKIQNNDPSQPPIYGAIKGSGALSLYLDLVNTDAQIKAGDLLVTSALEGTFPPNLLVGKIQSVNKNDVKPFQTAQVQSLFDVKNTDTLFVITNYKQTK